MNDGHGCKLDGKQEIVIAALLTSGSVSSAAKKSGIGEATIFRWSKDPAFVAAYTNARRQVLANAVGLLQVSLGHAITFLHNTMKDEKQPIRVRVDCARVITATALQVSQRMLDIDQPPIYQSPVSQDGVEEAGSTKMEKWLESCKDDPPRFHE